VIIHVHALTGHVFFAGAGVAAAAAPAFRLPSAVGSFLGMLRSWFSPHLTFFFPNRYIGDNRYIIMIGVFTILVIPDNQLSSLGITDIIIAIFWNRLQGLRRAFIAAKTPPAPQCTSQAPHRL
jgi:hypothetical protein